MTDRGLFLATMRRPEMYLVLAALLDLKWERCADWQDVAELEVMPYNENMCCLVMTDHYLSVCLDTSVEKPHFVTMRLHDADDPQCRCDHCHDWADAS